MRHMEMALGAGRVTLSGQGRVGAADTRGWLLSMLLHLSPISTPTCLITVCQCSGCYYAAFTPTCLRPADALLPGGTSRRQYSLAHPAAPAGPLLLAALQTVAQCPRLELQRPPPASFRCPAMKSKLAAVRGGGGWRSSGHSSGAAAAGRAARAIAPATAGAAGRHCPGGGGCLTVAKKMVAGVVGALGLMAAGALDRTVRLGRVARLSRARFWLACNANMHLWRLMGGARTQLGSGVRPT